VKRDRLVRAVSVALSLLIAAFFAWETVGLFRIIDDQGAIGTDLQYYRFVAERWQTTGVLYTPEQLAGPYVVETQVHNLYPPHALYLFVPFLYLPDLLWWVVPLAVLAYMIWWCRPTIWAWPIVLVLLALPKGPAQILFGNTDMWIAAIVACGVRSSWPGVLVSIKPSLALFGAVGVLSRRWWIAAAVVALLSLPFLSYWPQFVTITLNSSADLTRSLGNYPFLFAPIVAFLCSARRGGTPVRTWFLEMLGRRSAAPS
jgi:hypothetical protein